jgi:thiol-disulfide isomerase/thioredoxin
MTNRAVTLAIVCAGVCMLGVQIWVKQRPSPEDISAWARDARDRAAWRGRVAPDFELTLLDGSSFRLADRVGRHVIILNFFATWCGPCRAEMPELQRYAQAHEAEGVILLGIDAEEKHTVVEQFIRELRITFPVGIDGSGDLMKQYGVTSFPTTVVIGADGRVKLYETGAISNADVAFGAVVTPELVAIREGRGVTVDAYRAALAAEPRSDSEKGGPAPLTGRALKIAAAMPCPCGCDDKVQECRCSTSKQIKARLAKGGYDSKTDAEVMEELNKEFCMKGM